MVSMGKRIQRLRKERELTQEQAAEALGVTAAAVSKWETDAACPDVAMLAPLARLLKVTVDDLLDFRPFLAPEEIPTLLAESRRLFEEKRTGEARESAQALLREYPGDLWLRFHTASLFMAYLTSTKDETEVREQGRQAAELLEQCRESDQQELRDASCFVLANLYNMLEDPDRAMKAAEELPQPELNTRLVRANILLEKGEIKAAEREQQMGLYSAGRDVCLHLMGLAAIADRSGEPEQGLALLDKALAADELLEMERVGGMESSLRFLRASKLCTLGRLEEARQELERYVDTVLHLADMAGGSMRQGSGLYSCTELRPAAVSREFFLNTIRGALEECAEFQPLRGTPAWDGLLERLEEKKQ